MENIIIEIQKGIIQGDAQRTKEKTTMALLQGIDPEKIIEEGLLSPMVGIGQRFRAGELFIPDVLMSSRAMHASLYIIKANLEQSKFFDKGLIVIGTVAGDLHDIGKNMISMFLESQGYNIIDLGIDVPASTFVEAVKVHKPDILALSALLTTTVSEQQSVVAKLKEAGLRDKVKVIVGGGPVTIEFAESIGADGFGNHLFDTIDLVKRLTEN
ncbi:glycine betaine-specific corrinoid protein MtgC [Alkalibacter mobilis]|uniref:glycine betaine-specific corrinoid protein MtgC n=1 Tax=Alkalibacter mobilis TaxID=2787712 RepID=UPI00189F44A8|nr:corrinoid protein [Alkalibacter mobilis]MBF7096386.1 corrinoid protein [Alkalibacter mobilis]